MQHDRGEMLLGRGGQPFKGAYPFAGLSAKDEDGVEWDLSDYSHILWIDNDMSFTSRGFETLLNRDLDIVGGMYTRSDGPMCHMDFDGENAKPGSFEHCKDMEKPYEVFSVGFGFTLIKKGVFEKMADSENPWFYRFITEQDGRPLGLFGEDVAFGHNARTCGFKVHLDPTVRCGHYKRQLLFPGDVKEK